MIIFLTLLTRSLFWFHEVDGSQMRISDLADLTRPFACTTYVVSNYFRLKSFGLSANFREVNGAKFLFTGLSIESHYNELSILMCAANING